jgi:hypothetical protein
LVFADANTGMLIDTVLVIPRYTLSAGLGSGGGHGPSVMGGKVLIAHPFLYRQGAPFNPQQPKAHGVIFLWPDAFAGSGTTLDGVLVVAPGYKSQWVWDLWRRDGKTKTLPLALTPLADPDASKELQTISAVIGQGSLSGPSKELFSYAGEDPIQVRFTDEDKKTLRAFIAEGIEKLRPQP